LYSGRLIHILLDVSEDFLNLYTKKEAFVKGAYLEKPEKFDTLLLIDERTSIKNAKNGILITFHELVNKLTGRYSESSIRKALIELKLDNLIVVIPFIVYNELSRKLIPRYFIICRPEKKSYDIIDVYYELVGKCVEEISSYANSLEFNRDAFWKDLESSMLEDEHSEVFYPEIYFSIDLLFEMSDFEMNIEKRTLNQFKLDLMKALVLKRKAIELFNQHIFLLSNVNLEETSRTLSAFFYNRILPQYETVPVVERELDVIRLKEEIFKIEYDNKQLSRFTADKAYSVQRYFEEEKYKNQSCYPARIVFKLIHELEKFVNENMEKKNIEYIYTMYEELKNKICNRLEEPSQSMYFFTEAELEQYPFDSIEKVKSERSIVSTTWERRGGTVHVFMEMTFKNFNSSLEMLKNLPQNEFWKILAFRKLLQDSQKIKPDINPFNNPLFHKNYSILLNIAYQAIIPFYYNFFLWIRIGFVQDMVYNAIKRFVVDRQKLLERENQEQRKISKQAKLNQATLKKKYLKRILIRNRILEELDFFYFKQNLIPSISDVRERFPDIKEQQFLDIIEEFNFLTIPIDSFSQTWQKILYYPKSITWAYSLEKTKSNAELWLSLVAESSKQDNEEYITLAKRFHALNMKLQLI